LIIHFKNLFLTVFHKVTEFLQRQTHGVDKHFRTRKE
ncbi:unnamed protein product, partial [Allacma fusca]